MSDTCYSAAQNMEMDMLLFTSGRPAFRFYRFRDDCITAGRSQDMPSEIALDKALKMGVDAVKRPTGGGIVLHSRKDIIFSCVFPASVFPGGAMKAYYFVSDILLEGLSECGIHAERAFQSPADRRAAPGLCFSSSREFEIALGGKKLAGIAQKRTRDRILQQGAICVSRPAKDLAALLRRSWPIRDGLGLPAYIRDLPEGDKKTDKLLSLLTGMFSARFEKLSSFVV